jgi:outer membrane protein assembly factor BamE (lipoprotein component of BamABCDE complex)
MNLHHIPLYLLAAASLAACGQTVATHGHIILPSRLAQIQVGQTNQDDVRRLLGSPSTTGTLNDRTWYYITNTTIDKPLNPNILQKSELVKITFDPSGTVAGLEKKTEADSKDVEPSAKTTPTQGQALGIIDQMLDNIGIGK